MIVIPAKAGTQRNATWAPAFAGVTKWLIVLVFLAPAAPASAQTFPALTGRVVDQANLLRPEQKLDLTTKSEALEAQTGRQFVVATVNSLEGRTIEEYGYQLGRKWGIGDEKRDDGVILLVAPNEKKVRIETGYGARVFLTDAISGLIVQNSILPKFREGDLPGGIMAGADAIIDQMKLPPEQAQANIAKAEQKRARRSVDVGNFIPAIIIVIVFFSIIGSLARKSRGRRYRRGRSDGIDPWIVLWGLNELSRSRGRGGWSGGGGFGGGSWGGGGGGGFSGGGGSFGGGGASGGW